jgi:hypothetical protein
MLRQLLKSRIATQTLSQSRQSRAKKSRNVVAQIVLLLAVASCHCPPSSRGDTDMKSLEGRVAYDMTFATLLDLRGTSGR